MRIVARLLLVFATVVLPGLCFVAGLQTGCQQPIVPTNAIAAAESVARTATVAVNDAELIWPAVKASLPPSEQGLAQDAFDKSVFAANHALLALEDAIGAAIAANDPSPNFAALFSKLSDAVAQVVAVVQEFQGKVAANTAHAPIQDVLGDMRAAAARLKK